MTDSESLDQRIAQMLGKILLEEVDPAQPNARLIEDYGANSMDIVDIAERIERDFGINVPNDDVPKLKTFQDVLSYVQTRLAS